MSDHDGYACACAYGRSAALGADIIAADYDRATALDYAAIDGHQGWVHMQGGSLQQIATGRNQIKVKCVAKHVA